MNIQQFDKILFVSLLFLAEVFIVQGKAISSVIFQGSDKWIREESVLIHFLILLSALLYQWLRDQKYSLKISLFIAPAISLWTCTYFLIFGAGSSFTIFFVQLALYAAACIVIAIEPYLTDKMHPEFWRLMLSSGVKGIKYIIAIFVAGVAALKFVSAGVGESPVGFITTFFFPTVSLILVLFFIGYWALVPCWEQTVKAYTKNERSLIIEGRYVHQTIGSRTKSSSGRATDDRH